MLVTTANFLRDPFRGVGVEGGFQEGLYTDEGVSKEAAIDINITHYTCKLVDISADLITFLINTNDTSVQRCCDSFVDRVDDLT